MAVFTPVTEPQLAHWLQHYSLGPVLSLRGITAGIENSNFFLTTGSGHYVLTIFEKLTASELPFYLKLMQHLAAHQVPVPDPVVRNDGTLFGELCGKAGYHRDQTRGRGPVRTQCTSLCSSWENAGADAPGWAHVFISAAQFTWPKVAAAGGKRGRCFFDRITARALTD